MLCQMSYSRTLENRTIGRVREPVQSRSPTNGRGRSRTYEGVRRQIYSLLPLTSRAPYQLSRKLDPRPGEWRAVGSKSDEYSAPAQNVKMI